LATNPDADEPTPTPVQRAVRAVTAPSNRLPFMLAGAAAVAALAPFPLGAAGAFLAVLVAFESARRR